MQGLMEVLVWDNHVRNHEEEKRVGAKRGEGGVRLWWMKSLSEDRRSGMGMCGDTYWVSTGSVRPLLESQRDK